MKELLKELGFEGKPLPTRTVFDDAVERRYDVGKIGRVEFITYVCKYKSFVKQLMTKGMFLSLVEKMERF